jgi:murein DD-endopeptidase MepM/ murein hydrolase activator NlpD
LVVAHTFLSRLKAALFAAAIATGVIGAAPALANNNSNADIAAPLRAAEAARPSALGSGDDEFRALFTSWQSLDRTTPGTIATPTRRAGVSIPSLMPVANPAMTSGYGMRIHPVLGVRRGHRGIDLASPIGTPIHAAADGVISRADWFSTYGLYVSIEHGGQIETRYGHMSRLNVAAGQSVHKGDIIGYVGTTGRSTGPHLHYEVRIAGVAVNPLPYLQGDVHAASEGGQGGD